MSRILIVEDEISIAELEKDYLELSDYEVDIASDGETGESMALKEITYFAYLMSCCRAKMVLKYVKLSVRKRIYL